VTSRKEEFAVIEWFSAGFQDALTIEMLTGFDLVEIPDSIFILLG
jgi:hypothetical protein